MSKKYYFAARPETLVSVMKVGKLRDNLPSWVGISSMIFFKDIHSAIRASTTSKHQTFVVEIEPPEFDSTDLLTKRIDKDGRENSISANQIDIKWASHIYVFSQQGFKLATRLLNSESPVEITINPDIFEDFPQTSQNEQSSDKTARFFSDRNIGKDKSMITYIKRGDLLGSNMQTLINTVNTVGVMGKGIALSFKTQYPNMFADYVQKCKQSEVGIGKPYLYKVTGKRWIINFPTKKHWRNKSELSYIEEGLKYLSEHLQEWGVTSLAIPPLGCGNGQLDWQDVQPLIEKYLGHLQMPVEIYAPFIQMPKTDLRIKRRYDFEKRKVDDDCDDRDGFTSKRRKIIH